MLLCGILLVVNTVKRLNWFRHGVLLSQTLLCHLINCQQLLVRSALFHCSDLYDSCGPPVACDQSYINCEEQTNRRHKRVR